MKLALIHNAKGANGYSAFENALLEIIRKADELLIASPYIDIDLLHRYTSNVENWRLLTDLYSWSSVVGKVPLRNYLQKEHRRIRMVHGLHAKAFLSKTAALITSSNLTQQGFSRNEKLGVLITDQSVVADARAWFEHLWSSAGPLDLKKAISALREYSRPRVTVSHPNLRLGALPRKSKLRLGLNLDEGVLAVLRDKVLKNGIPKAALAAYFDLVAALIEGLGLSDDDPRLVLSIPDKKNRGYPSALAVTINNRYALNISGEKSARGAVGAIFPASYKQTIEKCCTETSSFEQHAGERDAPPTWAHFFPADWLLENTEYREAWLRQAKAELQRGKSSPFKRHHVRYLYLVAMDQDLRERVLDDIYHLT